MTVLQPKEYNTISINSVEKYTGNQKSANLKEIDKKIKSLNNVIQNESLDQQTLDRYLQLTQIKLHNVSTIKIPNNSINQEPEVIKSHFMDRLSLAAVVLLDFDFELLENLGIYGSTNRYLGAYVIDNFVKSQMFLSWKAIFTDEDLKLQIDNSTDKFLHLLKYFQNISAYHELFSTSPKNPIKDDLKYFEELLLEKFQKNDQGLVPIVWKHDVEHTTLAHLLLVQIQKYSPHFTIFNTFPSANLNHKNISNNTYEQNCALQCEAKDWKSLINNIFNSMNFSGNPNDNNNTDSLEETLTNQCIESLTNDCRVLTDDEVIDSKIQLQFGFACTVDSFHALFQQILTEQITIRGPEDINHSISFLSKTWRIFLKLYILQEFKSEVMHMGYEYFSEICESIVDQIEGLSNYEDPPTFLSNLRSTFGEIKNLYNCE